MSLIIVNKALYEGNEPIWLNRYMSFETFKKYFLESKGINISFSRIDTFPDGLEGWNYKIDNLKKAIDLMAQFNNRVIDDGGEIFENDCYKANTVKGFTDSKFDKSLIDENIKERKKHFVSCWFISNKINDENRVMWKLYANRGGELGVKITVKWIDLKSFLENREDEYYAGYVDYYGTIDDTYMFKKESSYKHENEFRILMKNNIKKERIPLYIDFDFLSKVHVCVDNSYRNKQILETLTNFNFTQEVSNKSYSISKLIPEFKKNKKNEK